jgi:hypothetical protein
MFFGGGCNGPVPGTGNCVGPFNRAASNPNGPMPTFQGQHNHACEAPTTRRTLRNDGTHHEDFFWHCAPNGPDSGHFMTAGNTTGGYAQTIFSPNQTFTDVREICWDQSMLPLPRRWMQVIVVPESVYLANGWHPPPPHVFARTAAPLPTPSAPYFNRPDDPTPNGPLMNYANPGLQSSPASNTLAAGPSFIHPDWGPHFNGLADFEANWAPQWDAYLLAFDEGAISQFSKHGEVSGGGPVNTDDPAPRFTQCLEDLGNGQIRHSNELPNGQTRVLTLAGELPDGPVRVIFQDANYNPTKHGGSAPAHLTWHWDDIVVEVAP